MQEKQLLIFFDEYTRPFEAIINLKQLFQRLPVTPAKIKARNDSESLLNEVRQII